MHFKIKRLFIILVYGKEKMYSSDQINASLTSVANCQPEQFQKLSSEFTNVQAQHCVQSLHASFPNKEEKLETSPPVIRKSVSETNVYTFK